MMQDTLLDLSNEFTQALEQKISTTKKNIIFLSHYHQYRSHYGNIPNMLKQKYNVIMVGGQELYDAFEQMGHAFVCIPFRAIDEHNNVHYLDITVDNVDLIITADLTTYQEEKIDKEFLSKTAKRLYFPHSLSVPTGAHSTAVDYIAVPSKIALEQYQQSSKATLLKAGYPRLDNIYKSLKDITSSNQSIIYAPTLKQSLENSARAINLLVGHDNILIEYLLKNRASDIIYRIHPYNRYHEFYKLLKLTWKNEKRVIFDESNNYDYFQQAAMLLTDCSTSAYTFSLCTLKPSLFFAPAIRHDIEQHCNIIPIAHNLAELKHYMDAPPPHILHKRAF